MTRAQYLRVAAVAALALSAIVITLAGYYENPALLILQVIFIAGPSFVPFIVLSTLPDRRVFPSLLCAVIVVTGWSYVTYVDTRPYTGGGASLATLFGWSACVVAVGLALVAISFRKARNGL